MRRRRGGRGDEGRRVKTQRGNDSTIRDCRIGDPDRRPKPITRVVHNRYPIESMWAEEEGEEMPQGEFLTSGSDTEAPAQGIAKVFRDLTVYGDPEVLHALIEGIEKRLADGWFRDREPEQRLTGGGRSRFFLFARRASAEQPAIALAMCAEGRRLSVTNIVPDGDSLSRAQYNSILVEFYLKFLHPAAAEVGLPIELSPDERSLEGEYGWQGAKFLKRFSGCANKSITHPADQRRWMDFLIHLHHRPNRDYDFGLLAKWLREDGWPADKTHRLISECEFALHLLSVYDSALGLAE